MVNFENSTWMMEEEGDGDDDGKDYDNGEYREDEGGVETEEKLGEDWTLALEVDSNAASLFV